MRKFAITLAVSAAILSLGASANAMVGSPSPNHPVLNYTPKHEAACRGWGRWCGPGFVRACNPWRCWCRPCW
jgi:hypothetical protein